MLDEPESRELIAEEPDGAADEVARLEAIAKLVSSSPPMDVLRRWARRNPPPQEWFDEDCDLL